MCLHKLPLKLEKSSRATSVSEEHYLEVGGNDKSPGVGRGAWGWEHSSWNSLRGAQILGNIPCDVAQDRRPYVQISGQLSTR